MKKIINNHQSGQALVTLLVFAAVGIILTTTSVALTVTNARSSLNYSQGLLALDIAESGIENALITLLRNPSYTGEVITIGDGEATVVVTGINPKTVRSTGQLNNSIRIVEVQTSSLNGIFTVDSWREVQQ